MTRYRFPLKWKSSTMYTYRIHRLDIHIRASVIFFHYILWNYFPPFLSAFVPSFPLSYLRNTQCSRISHNLIHSCYKVYLRLNEFSFILVMCQAKRYFPQLNTLYLLHYTFYLRTVHYHFLKWTIRTKPNKINHCYEIKNIQEFSKWPDYSSLLYHVLIQLGKHPVVCSMERRTEGWHGPSNRYYTRFSAMNHKPPAYSLTVLIPCTPRWTYVRCIRLHLHLLGLRRT